jgi:hypothetical protein
LEQPQYPIGQEMPPPTDGDRGLGKGLLMGAGGLLAGAFVAHKIEEHKHHNHFWSGGSKLPLASAGAGGLLGAMGSHLPFGNNSAAPPPPQPQPQPQVAPPQHHGFGSYMPAAFGGGGGEPRLNITAQPTATKTSPTPSAPW